MSAGRAGTDMIGQALQAQIAERKAAADAVGQISSAARGQDLDLNKFNTGETNTNRRLDATNQTNVSMGNAANTTQANVANAAGKNMLTAKQGDLSQQLALFNTEAANRRDNERAGYAFDASKTNAGFENDRTRRQAELAQQGQQFDVESANTRALEQARLDQRAGEVNLESQLKQMGLNDQATEQFMRADLENARLAQTGQISAAELQARRQMLREQLANAIEIAKMSKPDDPGFWDYVANIGGDLLGYAAPIIGGALAGPPGAAAGATVGSAMQNGMNDGWEF